MSEWNGGDSFYAGRWAARLRGKIIAQGETPEQALRAAQQSRPKEKPEIVFMLPLPAVIQKTLAALPQESEIHLVGGALRDFFLSRQSFDFDFAVPAGGIALARKAARALDADFFPLDEERDTGRVVVRAESGARIFLDFAVYRGASLEADLRARDFCMNALAYDLRNEKLIDPLGGGNDLRARIIRACSPDSFADDPLRILRAVRQAAAFDFHIEKQTRAWMRQAVPQLTRVSPERLRDELFKMLSGPKADSCILALDMLGALPHLLPELPALKGLKQSPPHVFDVWRHTLALLNHLDGLIRALRVGYDAEKTSDMFTGLLGLRLGRYRERFAAHFADSLNVDRPHRGLLFFAALYHDAGKPYARTAEESGKIRFLRHEIKSAELAVDRLRAFNLSAEEIRRVETIVLCHMRLHDLANCMEREGQPPSRKAVYKFFRETGEAGVDLILLALADARAVFAQELTIETWTAYLDVARLLLENYWERPEEAVSPPRLLDGDVLMRELNLKPGRRVGQLLEAIRENQAAGAIQTREQALAFAREELQKPQEKEDE